MNNYKIVRFYKDERSRVIKRGLSLDRLNFIAKVLIPKKLIRWVILFGSMVLPGGLVK